MSGNFAVLPLTSGQLQTTVSALYTSPAVTYIKQVLLYNESQITVTLQLYLQPAGGNPVPFRQVVLEAQESYEVLKGGGSITLGVGDSIAGGCNTAAAIDYTLTGVTET